MTFAERSQPSPFPLLLLLLLAFKRLMMPTRTQATQALSSTGSVRHRRRRRLSIIFACNFHNIFVLDHLHRDTKTRLPFCERECVQLCLLSNKSFTDLYSVHTTYICTCVCRCELQFSVENQKLLALTRVLINLLPRREAQRKVK